MFIQFMLYKRMTCLWKLNLHIVLPHIQYLDQLIGPILFRWVACEVSLVSLLEVIICSSAFHILINDSEFD
jgi:hypothetical protein